MSESNETVTALDRIRGWREKYRLGLSPSPLEDVTQLSAQLDMTHAHPSGIAQLFASGHVQLDSLFRDNGMLRAAGRRVERVLDDREAKSRVSGVGELSLVVGVAIWKGNQMPVLMYPVEVRKEGRNIENGTVIAFTGRVRLNAAFAAVLRENNVVLDESKLFDGSNYESGTPETSAVFAAITRLAANAFPDFEIERHIILGCFMDPASQMLVESRKIIDQIKGQVDVIVGVMHMDVENEYGVYGSGVTDLANACPEFDVIVAAHGHKSIPNQMINNVLVVENKNAGATVSEIHLYLQRGLDGKWKVKNRTSENLLIKDYAPDPELTALLAEYDARAKEDAVTPIGELRGGDLAPANEIDCLPQAMIQDTALLDFINEVQMYYTGAQVSATALTSMTSQMKEGTIRKCDMASIYTYQNTLYKLQMTGEQLRRFMEWSAAFFKTWKPDEVTIAFDPSVRYYLYDAFEGVNYELDVSKEPGHRIKNLKWPNGKAVKDTDTFVVAVNNYRATTQLLTAADIFLPGEELPKLLEIDVRGDVGGIRELLGEYIRTVKGGTIEPHVNNNWKIVGNNWKAADHQKAVQLLREGKLALNENADARTLPGKAITTADIAKF